MPPNAQGYFYAGDYWSKKTIGLEYASQISQPAVSEYSGAHSIDQLAAASNGEIQYSMEMGWTVDPGLFPGSYPDNPHLFIYVNKDKYQSNGQPGGDCYDCEFTPFSGATAVPGEAFGPSSTNIRMGVKYYQGNWWIWFGTQWIGYVHGSFWGNHFTTAEYDSTYGEVYDNPLDPVTQMGDGQYGGSAGATSMTAPILFLNENQEETTGLHNPPQNVPNPEYYSIGDVNSGRTEWHLGGPGEDPSPYVTTNAASEIGEEQATLNGSVNPEGLDTHYYFEYGKTTAYGSYAPARPGNDVGSGISTVSASATTTQLEPEITYHYRLVASNNGGTAYGSDQTLLTTGRQGLQVAVQGSNNTLDYYEDYVNEPWNKAVIGGEGSTYGTPSVVRFKDRFGKGLQLVVQGPNHTLDFYTKYDGEPWSKAVIGGEGSTYGTPSMVRFSDKYGTGLQLVVEGANHTLDFYADYDNEPWSKAVIGSENSTYGTPSLVRFNDKYGTGLQLAVKGPNNTLDFYTNYDNQPWSKAVIGSENSTYGTPSLVRFNDKYGTGVQLVVEGTSHTLDFYTNYDNEPWSKAVIGSENSTYGTPSMARFNDRYGTGLQLAVKGPNNTLDFYTNYDNQPWSKAVIGSENSTYGTPSLVRFSNGYGTGIQLVVEGANHTLDFWTNYDNEPWGKAVIGSGNSTYGTPSMVELHAPIGALEL